MKVKDVMSAEVHGVRTETPLTEVAEKMRTLDVGSIPVVSEDGDRVVGIVTDRDIVLRSVSEGHDTRQQKAEDVMSHSLVCCREEDEVASAATAMKAKKVRRVLVLNDAEKPVGIVSIGDLARSGLDKAELASVLRNVSMP